VAWINTIPDWRNLESAVKWLCLHFLCAGSRQDVYNAAPLLEQVVTDRFTSSELIVDSETFALWLSSTWTLQESCLCPDIILCNEMWRPLEVASDVAVSLHQLLTIFSLNREAYFEKPVAFADWPRAAAQLSCIQTMVSGTDVEVLRTSIMSLGVTRECLRRRGDAIMPALGVTDWYDDYLTRHGSPPPDKDMVLGSDPLSFVRKQPPRLAPSSLAASTREYTIRPLKTSMDPSSRLGSRATILLVGQGLVATGMMWRTTRPSNLVYTCGWLCPDARGCRHNVGLTLQHTLHPCRVQRGE
jgi:hypothetical protein